MISKYVSIHCLSFEILVTIALLDVCTIPSVGEVVGEGVTKNGLYTNAVWQ